jgi:Tol biopolymer transport system component
MSLTAGTRLGPYEILEAIGKGGMGEVFKAKDTRLDRFVAVKILPAEWAQDAGMKERFDREAQAIGSLNHPNICHLHDVGFVAEPFPISYLVMEYLQGETLAARIARGPLSLDEALDVAVPIADALDQAHRRGVVHRDLKPGNIMLTDAGPKLLDFGLARTPAAPAKRGSGSAPEAATVGAVPTTPLTTPGLLIGTLQYMAPEQLDGFEADARTDIFAFGTVLHEMITGKRAFEGKSQVLLISSIATSEPPPLSLVEPATPPALEHVVRTCLAKNPDDRWQTARDLLAELKWIADGGAAATAVLPVAAHSRGRSKRILYLLAAVAVMAAVVLAVPAYSYFQGPAAPQETRFRFWSTPFDDTPHPDGYFAISPDGKSLVYRGDEDSVNDPQGLYVGRVGEVTVRRLPLTDEPTQPFWSPEGRYVGYVANGRLMKVDVSGGPPQEIAPAKGLLGATWNADGTILFGSAAGIYKVSAEGGTPELAIARGDKDTGLYWPRFLPDGRHFLYLAWSADASSRAVMAASLGAPERTLVMKAESNAMYTSAGHLVFHRGDAVYAQPFDATTLKLSGEPTRIAAQVLFNPGHGLGAFDVSRDGVLVYGQTDPAAGTAGGQETRLWQPAWIDRTGREIAKVGSYQMYRGAEVSPDGTRIALHRHDDTGGDVWIIEPSGTDTRLTYDPTQDNSMPIWSPPDGQHIVFSSHRAGKWGLYRRLSDGRGTEELLFESDRLVVPMSWAPDGKRIVFGVSDAQTNGDLWVLTLEAAGADPAKSTKPEAFVATPSNETHGQVSPDGRWIAYASNETKADQYEVYVRPFPTGAGRWQVSRTGGDWPRWSRDGKELFFLSNVPENSTSTPGTLSAVKVGAKGDTFIYDPPVETLQCRAINLDHPGGEYPTYAVGKDGKLLVFILASVGATTATGAPTVVGPDQEGGLTVARNWERGLKKKK